MTSFKDQWGLKPSSEYAENTEGNAESENAAEVILRSLRVNYNDEKSKWLSSLAQQIQPAASSTEETQPLDQQTALKAGLSRLFNEFEKHALAFNETAAGTDFIVSVTHPLTPGLDAPEETQAHTRLQGNLATRLMAMVIEAKGTNLEVYIIPASSLLALTTGANEQAFDPLLIIQTEWNGQELTWLLCGGKIPSTRLPHLAEELFGDLIGVATGRLKKSEITPCVTNAAVQMPPPSSMVL